MCIEGKHFQILSKCQKYNLCLLLLLLLFSQNKQLRGKVSHLADTSGKLLEFHWSLTWEGATRIKTRPSPISGGRYGIHSCAIGRVFIEAVVIINPHHPRHQCNVKICSEPPEESVCVRASLLICLNSWST